MKIFTSLHVISCAAATLVACGDAPLNLHDTETSPLQALVDHQSCNALEPWPTLAQSAEVETLLRVNAVRAKGATCGEKVMPPVPPIAMNEHLTCAARKHSADMSKRDFFSHDDPEKHTAADRITATGYKWRAYGENIAWGQQTPEHVVDTWVKSPGHCMNIMGEQFTDAGVGYVVGEGSRTHLWTLDFAAPYPS